MMPNRSMPACTVIPVLTYPDVGAAIAWLTRTFGFTERWRAGDHRAQLAVGDGAVVVTGDPDSGGANGRESGRHRAVGHVMIRVADVDGHHKHVQQQGAEILGGPTDYPYGERQYDVVDPAGHRWSFSQSIADVAPEEWGGTSNRL